MVNHVVKSFSFANNNHDLVVVTKDCKIRFYSLMRFEGIFLREIANCHRGSITGMTISANSGYFITGGEDNMIKIWDYEAQKTVPYYFQSFIGHTYPVNSIIFNPRNNGQVISVGQHDGIFVWEFNGDIESDFKQQHLAGQDLPSSKDIEAPSSGVHEPQMSLLEKIRTTNKAKKAFRNQMSEDTFIIPEFKNFERANNNEDVRDFYESPTFVKQKRDDRKLTYNHYCDCARKFEMQPEASGYVPFGERSNKSANFEQKLVNGYDGYGGVHDNLVWNVAAGFTYFTLNNKLIIENTKTREQTVFSDSTVQLSSIAVSADFKYIAVGEGSTNAQGNSLVILYDVDKKKCITKLPFHQKGIQAMAFSNDGRFLVSVGVQGEDIVAVWDIGEGRVKDSKVIQTPTVNQVKMDPTSIGDTITFYTVGNEASFTTWRFSNKEDELIAIPAKTPQNLKSINFLSMDITGRLPEPADGARALIGADDGSIVLFDFKQDDFFEIGKRGSFIDGQIGCVSIRGSSVVVGTSTGMVACYHIVGDNCQPEDPNYVEYLNAESAIIAMSFDE
jgi:WD40 repeat protein